MVSRIRIWSPFVIAYFGGLVTLAFEVRIADNLGIYNPLFGYMFVEVYAGVLLGVVAGLVSLTRPGLLTFVLGLMAMGETTVVVGFLNGEDVGVKDVTVIPLLVALIFGFFGVPAYVIVAGTASALRSVFLRTDDHPG
jgi:hypothetical protein